MNKLKQSWWLFNILSLSFSPGSRDSIMEVWRNGSVKHLLTLPEQQRGSTATFSSVLLLPEVPHTPFVWIWYLSILWYTWEWLVFPSLCRCVFVRGRSCGVFVWSREKCVFGTWKTLANRFTVWFFRTASAVAAWSKLKTRSIFSTNTHTHKTHRWLTMQIIPAVLPKFSSRCGLAVSVAVLPKGRSTSWTWNATWSWRSFKATAIRWRRSAPRRTGMCWVELGSMTERLPSGRWSRGTVWKWTIFQGCNLISSRCGLTKHSRWRISWTPKCS